MGHIRDRWKDPARKGKGKRWQVRYRVDGRERDGGSFEVKAIAQRKLTELESSVHRGAWSTRPSRPPSPSSSERTPRRGCIGPGPQHGSTA